MTAENALLLLPETVLVAGAVVVYLAGAFVASRAVWNWVALAAVAIAGMVLYAAPGSAAPAEPVATDTMAWYGRWLSLGFGALLVLLAWRPSVSEDQPEYVGSLLLVIAGMMLVSGAQDLVLLFVGLELISIPTYILLYLPRRDAASQESAAKYFYLSVFASAILLYGLSFLYGAAGSTDLSTIARRLGEPPVAEGTPALARLALVLVVSGLSFRVAAVPFHFYAPDVYQGTTHANAGLLSVAPKVAGFVVLVRVVAGTLPGAEPFAWPLVTVLSVLTMTLGNVVALWQDNLRRLLAYSSIAHAGYLLIGLAVRLGSHPGGSWDGVAALFFYLVVYGVATIGVFAALSALGRNGEPVETIDDLAGLARAGGVARPVLAWSLAVLLFSLAGLPPLAGFWGKLALFAGAVDFPQFDPGARPCFAALAVLGVLNSVVSAVYYLRITGAMFFRAPAEAQGSAGREGAQVLRGAQPMVLAAVSCVVLVLSIGLRPGPWMGAATEAGAFGRRIPAAAAAAEAAGREVATRPGSTESAACSGAMP
ncbi:MAG: NADH-quinone oxidoreductase subunit N [Thermoguttaceae bacterium]|jgi:NADH-quinone oxidoreductase subunit N|nr:NADH-quinone oxidoreductase subunit N [Thermoguttaceae bacterium]